MITLVKLFPPMTGDLVDEEDEHWKCFQLLWDICSRSNWHGMASGDIPGGYHLVWSFNTYTQDASLRPLSSANAIVSVSY